MTKSKSITDKIKSVGNFIKRNVVLPATMITAGVLYSQNADAQKSRFPENHDNGAAFYKGKTNSVYKLEEKVFFNSITGKEERFYVQYIAKDKYENDLDIAALDFYKTIPRMNLQTGRVGELRSENGSYEYFPETLANGEEANSIVIDNLHIEGWCDDQKREEAGVQKGVNYISITDMEKLLPEQERLKLGDNRRFIVLTLPKDKQVKGKTNHYLIPVDGEHEIGFNPETKKLTIFGTIYRGILNEQPVKVDAKTGVASPIGTDLGRDSTFVQPEQVDSTKKEKFKFSKLALIAGANGNENFLEGDFGVKYGSFAVVGNYGGAKNEEVLNITTESSPITGRYGTGTKEHTDMKVKGIKLETHLLNDKRISPFFGIGMNNWTYTTNSVEQIRAADGTVLKENSNSIADSENSLKANAGLNLRLGKKVKVGAEAQYDTKAGVSGGVRLTIGLN